MRGQQTWAGVKPVLKVLQESFPAKVRTVYILKPDNFWQKQKASLGSSKYAFEVGVDALFTLVSSVGSYLAFFYFLFLLGFFLLSA